MDPRYHLVHFDDDGEPTPVPEGSTLLDAARQMGVDLSHVCNGMGSCSTCRVIVLEGGDNLSPRSEGEDAYNLNPGVRLACQAQVMGDVKVKVRMIMPVIPMTDEW